MNIAKVSKHIIAGLPLTTPQSLEIS